MCSLVSVMLCLVIATSLAQDNVRPDPIQGNKLVPINHARLTFQTSDQNYSRITLSWSFAFPDTNYTFTCSPLASNPGSLWEFIPASITPTSVEIEYSNYQSQQLTIHCIGVHD
jgi:hypothetical protein